MLNTFLDFIFPKYCVGCSKSDTYFCSACNLKIQQTELVCPKCERLSLGGVVHPVCKRKFGLDGLWSLGIYKNPLKAGIQKLKYRYITELADVLINITLEYWAKYGPLLLGKIKKSRGKNWLIVPVPLHKYRENWRGFNQAELLASAISRKLDLEFSDCLKRIKETKTQVGQSAADRRDNMKNAFRLNPKLEIRNSNILLVDDVWTTGSTLKECCYVLKRGGAKTVWALTLAR